MAGTRQLAGALGVGSLEGRSVVLPTAGAPRGHGPAAARRARRASIGPARTSELKALISLSDALASTLELRPTVERALQVLLQVPRCRATAVLLVDWQTREAEVYSARQGSGGYAFQRLDLEPPTLAPEALSRVCAELPPPRRGRQLLSGPITAGGHVLGLLVADLPAPRRSPSPASRLLTAMGQRLGASIANARLYERTRQEADQLAAVNAVGNVWRRSLRLPRLLDEVLQQLTAVTNLEFGLVFLPGEPTGALAVAAHRGMGRAAAARVLERQALLRSATRPKGPADEQPVVEENLPPAPADEPTPAPRCLMYVPLRSEGRPLGVLAVGSYTHSSFAPGAPQLLAAIGSRISLALANARLYEELNASARHLAATNEALREAVRGKDQFLANVTHELKRPLAPARLVLETLLEAPPGKLTPQRQERLLRNALGNLDNMNALVSQLLDAVRLRHHSGPARDSVFDLGRVARLSLAAMRPLAEAHDIQVRSIIPTAATRVRGDPEAMARAITNLLSNAIKFNREKGSVLLQLERAPEGHAILSVTDTGIGIPPQARLHIFEHFYQVDSTSTRSHDGLGLGLYIAREIVEQHHGEIRFDSEEGVGSTFTIVLPLA